MVVVQISKAKPKLLELARDVAATGVHALLTKHGRPLAKIVPCDPADLQQLPQEEARA